MNFVDLPTAKQYIETIEEPNFMDQFTEYSEPKYKCPKIDCGGGMCKNNTIVLTSNPPKFIYKCNKCGCVDYQFK